MYMSYETCLQYHFQKRKFTSFNRFPFTDHFVVPNIGTVIPDIPVACTVIVQGFRFHITA